MTLTGPFTKRIGCVLGANAMKDDPEDKHLPKKVRKGAEAEAHLGEGMQAQGFLAADMEKKGKREKQQNLKLRERQLGSSTAS